MIRVPALLVVSLLGACASPDAEPQPPPGGLERLLPGTIGVVVRGQPEGLVVVAVRDNASAVRKGDLVVRYNDVPVGSVREFNRLVVDSRPGSLAELELVRAGVTHRVQLPVRQLDTTPRG